MASCAVRESARAVTLPQLRNAGLDVSVFYSPCNPAGPEQNRAFALEAISFAEKMGKPTLYVEDDIDLDFSSFAWAVSLAVRLDAVTYLYLNDSPARLREHFGRGVAAKIEQRESLLRGAYAIRERAALFGTQCVLIPARLLPTMTRILLDDDVRNRRSPWDGRLHSWLRANREEPVYSILPHPVQHRQDRTGRSSATRVMKSMSFGLPSSKEPQEEDFIDSWQSSNRYRPVLRTRESIAQAFTKRRLEQRDHESKNR